MAGVLVEVQESWYGEAEVRGKDTWLWVKLGPSVKSFFQKVAMGLLPERKLVIQGFRVRVPGLMVVGTTRRAWVSDTRPLTAPIPRGKPELAVRMSYDPQGDQGSWRVHQSGLSYPVKLVRVKRRTAWERL